MAGSAAAASPVEMTAALSTLPPEAKAKLSAALAEKEGKGRPQDDVSELRGLIPHVLQALHTNKVWESVKGAEEISCEKFKGDYTSKPHIGILTPRNTEESPVVVKF